MKHKSNNIYFSLFFFIFLQCVAQNTFAQNLCPEISQEKKSFVQLTFKQFERNCGSLMIYEVIGRDVVSCAFLREWVDSPKRGMEQRVIRDPKTCDIVWEQRSHMEPQWAEVLRQSAN